MPQLRLQLTAEEAAKLLSFVGHDAVPPDTETVKLVRTLYRALSGPLTAVISDEQLLILHRVWNVQAFGEGGRAFQQKLADAFRQWDQAEDVPGLAAEPESDEGDEAAKLALLDEWRHQEWPNASNA